MRPHPAAFLDRRGKFRLRAGKSVICSGRLGTGFRIESGRPTFRVANSGAEAVVDDDLIESGKRQMPRVNA